MLKRISVFILIVMLLVCVPVHAVDTCGGYVIPIDIDINGNFIKCACKPVLIEGTTYIPLRAFSDAVGGMIEWDAAEGAASMQKDGHLFVFYPGKTFCVMDGSEKPYASVIYQDLTYIPVRIVSEMLDYSVEWDEFYLTVKITAPGVEVPVSLRDTSYTYEDILYLGKITQVESGYQHFDVQLGVADTIVNRVKSSQFPNSVKEVIFDTKYSVQYPPAHTEKFNKTPSKESMIAAKCALNGINIVRNSLYFIDVPCAASSWAHNNRPHYATLHDMCFYE